MFCQRDKFQLSDDITFINGAYMSPLLKSVESAGIKGMIKKRMPSDLTANDFFEDVNKVRKLFAQLIGAAIPDRVVLVPSASYALANVAYNIPENGRKKIILLEDQFPSNYYIWDRIARDRGFETKIINKPNNRDSWSELILEEIDKETLAVAMAPIQWGDGSLFDIKRISSLCRSVGSLFVLDGTQSVGALPYDQEEIKADALIVAAYKWMLGPYAIGFAYYGDAFDSGEPIEESWLNRVGSEDFQYLTRYQSQYRAGARKYEMGEAPDFIKIPMLQEAIQQLLEWSPLEIQRYCRSLISPMLDALEYDGYIVPNRKNMASHLFGIGLKDGIDMEEVKRVVAAANISVSYRGEYIRVSPNVYNTETDLDLLKSILLSIRTN